MDGSITTNKGIALIGKLLAQKGALQITRVAVGDGTPPASPATLNALVHELKNATIESVDNPKNGEAKIVVTVSSIGVTQGFFVKEIGVFAKDTDGKEILYAYAGFSDNPQWIRPEARPSPTWRPMTSTPSSTAFPRSRHYRPVEPRH